MKIHFSKHTEIGGRERNEDSIANCATENGCYFVLADGLGGHGLGDVASALVCETAMDYCKGHSAFSNQLFDEVFLKCQTDLLNKQIEANAAGKMRTTMNLLCFDTKQAYWAHIGDSRIYYFKDKTLVRRTLDHSVPQMLAAMGEIKEEDIRFHEDRNRVLRVLGVEGQTPAFEAETPISLSGDEQFLMCTDGFWEMINEKQMQETLAKAQTPGEWLTNMLEIVHKNGEGTRPDNTTAIAVWTEKE